VLMSATAEAGLFHEYFERGAGVATTSLLIPGFTHPVAQYFLHNVLELTGYAIGKASRWARKGKPQVPADPVRPPHPPPHPMEPDRLPRWWASVRYR
jgi:hypothetical protein